MKTIKKLLSLLLIAAMMIPAFAVVASDDVTDAEFPEEMIVLHELGIIELTDPGYALTKGDLAIIMAELVYPDVNAVYSGSYHDVNKGLASAKAIQVLSDMGCIEADSKYFNPLIKATGNDVAAIFAGGILGYNAVADDVWSAAVSAGIFRRSTISKNSPVTMSQMAEFIYENLDTPCLTGFDGSYSANEDFTVLRTLGLRQIEGRLVCSHEGSVYGYDAIENKITVETSDGDVTMKTGAADVSGYLGATGSFYYSAKNKDTLVYAAFDAAEAVTVSGESITKVTDSRIYFEDENGDEDFITYSGAPVVYNGCAVNGKNTSLYVQPDHGYLKILKDGKNTISVYTWDYTVGVIAAVNTAEQKIIFEKTVYETPTLVADEFDEVRVEVNGKERGFSDLARGMVAWYAINGEKNKVSIFASGDNAFWASLDSTEDDFITLSGTKYHCHEQLFNSGFHGELKLGETGTFYLNPTGEIFAYKPDRIIEQNMYGYLLKATKPKGGLDGNICVRIVNELGQTKEYNLAKKVKLSDGNFENDYKTVLLEAIPSSALFENGVLRDGLVKYTLNSNGEISRISLPQDVTNPVHPNHDMGFSEGNFSMVLKNNPTDGYYMRYDSNGTGKFDNKYIARSDCKVFYIKDDLSAGEVTTCANTLSRAYRDNVKTTGAELSLYNSDRNLEVEMVVLKYSEKAMAVNTAAFVVDKITRSLDSNKDERIFICGYSGNNYVKYTVDDEVDVSAVMKGEVVQLGVSDGEVYSVKSLIKPDDEAFYYSKYNSGAEGHNANANMHSVMLCFKGKLYSVNDSYDRIVVHTGHSWDTYRSFALSGATVYVYDKSKDTLSKITAAEFPAVSYDDGAEIAFFAQSSIVKTIVVYQ